MSIRKSHRLEAALTFSKARAMNRPQPCVYVLECEGFIKIGYAADPWTRIKEMQTGNPFDILLLGLIPTWEPIREEAELHARFAEYKHRGEWFKLPENEVKSLINKAFLRFEGQLTTTDIVRHVHRTPDSIGPKS